jgi:hypothetical protein
MLHAAAGVQHVRNLRAAAGRQQQEGSSEESDDESAESDEDTDSEEDTDESDDAGAGQDWREVPAWHEKVYEAFGLPAGVDLTGVFVLWEQSSLSMTSVQVLGLALQMIGGGFWNKVRLCFALFVLWMML